MNIVLIGFMGAGKTAVGRVLAMRLGYRFIDIDQYIEDEQGCSVQQIFVHAGEEMFRSLETKALKDMSFVENTVVSTGGGILTTEGNGELIKDIGPCVYLNVDLDIIFKRVSMNTARPLLKTPNPRQTIEDLFAKRKHLYEGAADVTIESDDMSIYQVTSLIIRNL